MIGEPEFGRRTFLRGLGTLMAVPLLESLLPRRPLLAAGAAAPPRPPPLNRVAFLYVPNGMHMPDWTPKGTASRFDLPPLLDPLKALRGDFQDLPSPEPYDQDAVQQAIEAVRR